MNVFGVGAWELLAILLIMLVFAGPKRMIHWSYILGQHVSKFRKIWSETVDLVQKEFDEAGVDIKLPKEPPTRKNFNRAVTDAMKPMTKPVQDSLDEVKKDLDTVKEVSDTLNNKQPKTTPAAAKSNSKSPSREVKLPEKPASPKPRELAATVAPAATVTMGTWGGGKVAADQTGANGSAANLGTWSNQKSDD